MKYVSRRANIGFSHLKLRIIKKTKKKEKTVSYFYAFSDRVTSRLLHIQQNKVAFLSFLRFFCSLSFNTLNKL